MENNLVKIVKWPNAAPMWPDSVVVLWHLEKHDLRHLLSTYLPHILQEFIKLQRRKL